MRPSRSENLDRVTEALAKQRGLAVGDALDLKAFLSAVKAWGSKEGKDTVVMMPGGGGRLTGSSWIWGE